MEDKQRKVYRMEHAKPILDRFKQWADLQIGYLDEGFQKPDNNKAEQHMRPIALGRKNYLFIGSDRGGKAAATYYSLVETCKNLNINPQLYLTDLLTRLPECKTQAESLDLVSNKWLNNGIGG